MTSRKKRVLLIQIVIFIFASFLIYITYYNKKIPEKTADNLLQSEKKKTKEELQSNTFENVEYKGIDLNGNRYVLKSESADFESSMPELVNMKVMVAIFYFKDGSVLSVKGEILIVIKDELRDEKNIALPSIPLSLFGNSTILLIASFG